jgi:hypothetical protein
MGNENKFVAIEIFEVIKVAVMTGLSEIMLTAKGAVNLLKYVRNF